MEQKPKDLTQSAEESIESQPLSDAEFEERKEEAKQLLIQYISNLFHAARTRSLPLKIEIHGKTLGYAHKTSNGSSFFFQEYFKNEPRKLDFPLQLGPFPRITYVFDKETSKVFYRIEEKDRIYYFKTLLGALNSRLSLAYQKKNSKKK